MNMRKPFRLALTLFLLGCLHHSIVTAEECDLRLEIDSVEWRGGYDVFDAGEYPQTVYFKVYRTGEPCSFFVTFGSGLQGGGRAATFFGETIQYQIYNSVEARTVLKELPAASSNEVLSGSFAPDETVKELSYAIVVPPLQVVASGQYTDTFQVSVYQGTPESFIEKDSRAIVFTIPVQNVTELSLVGRGATFDPHAKARGLDFGKLSKGKRMGFDLRVRSNTPYRIKLESENGGVMQNLDPSVSTTIPYTLELEGGRVGLEGDLPVELSRGNQRTHRTGQPHGFEVIIGDATGAVAGTYRDTIVFTVISE